MKKLILFLPVIFGVIVINYLLDPANLFNQITPHFASLLLQNKDNAFLANGDNRLLQKYYIDNLVSRKDIIVLGSSRSAMISSDFFPGKNFFNNSLTGARLEDLIAVYEMYANRNMQPSIIIIGLDPWILNRNNGLMQWTSLKNEYQAGMKRMGLPVSRIIFFQTSDILPDKYLELLSPVYFQESLKLMGQKPWKALFNIRFSRNDDASSDLSKWPIGYDTIYKPGTISDVRRRAISYVSGNVYGLENFNELDSNYKKQFNSFIYLLTNSGIKVILFLPPYHPIVYDYLTKSKKYQIISEAQNYFRSLSSNQIMLVGSYNPADISCSEHDFADGMHASKECIAKLFVPLTQNNLL